MPWHPQGELILAACYEWEIRPLDLVRLEASSLTFVKLFQLLGSRNCTEKLAASPVYSGILWPSIQLVMDDTVRIFGALFF